jgi:hypothetical protein
MVDFPYWFANIGLNDLLRYQTYRKILNMPYILLPAIPFGINALDMGYIAIDRHKAEKEEKDSRTVELGFRFVLWNALDVLSLFVGSAVTYYMGEAQSTIKVNNR